MPTHTPISGCLSRHRARHPSGPDTRACASHMAPCPGSTTRSAGMSTSQCVTMTSKPLPAATCTRPSTPSTGSCVVHDCHGASHVSASVGDYAADPPREGGPAWSSRARRTAGSQRALGGRDHAGRARRRASAPCAARARGLEHGLPLVVRVLHPSGCRCAR